MNKTKENEMKQDCGKQKLEVFLVDERYADNSQTWKFQACFDIKDINDFIKDIWCVVGEERAKGNGDYSFEQVVQASFQGLARVLDLDHCIKIERRSTNGITDELPKFSNFINEVENGKRKES